MAKQRLSKLQELLLEELSKTKDKCSSPEALSLRVANRYKPGSVWRLADLVKELIALRMSSEHVEMGCAIAQSHHKKEELVRNKFSATFSRSLRNLDKKGLVQLIKGQFKWDPDDPGVIRRIATKQPRIALIIHNESPYFGDRAADANRIVNAAHSQHYNLDVNNKALIKYLKTTI